uniref:RING-type domain-containing protein n=1 Tax=Anopheles farauti TaxID=69004 RepID=A0A182QB33_9DIPT
MAALVGSTNASAIVSSIDRALDLNKEQDRLQTFVGWYVEYILPTDLARWGFYYTGCGDIVQCRFCSIELGHWSETDVVATEHLKWSRHCPLMTKRQTNNVPIDPHFLDQLPDIVPDVYGYHRQIEPVPSSSAVVQVATKSCKHQYPDYATEAARLASFSSWPKSIKQTPEQMVDAGFFYTKKSDIVACFSCGGVLNEWVEGDDPWVEHAVTFSGCHYLNLMKGSAFVEQCLLQKAHGSSSGTATASRTEEKRSEPEGLNVADAKLCKICYANPYNTTFVPCGHVVACAKCASAVDRCPLCNQQFDNVYRVYFG